MFGGREGWTGCNLVMCTGVVSVVRKSMENLLLHKTMNDITSHQHFNIV